MSKNWQISAAVVILLPLLAGCASNQPVNSGVPSATSTVSPQLTEVKPTDTLEALPSATLEPSPTATLEPSPTATPTQEPFEITFPEPPYELGNTLTRTADGMVMVFVPGGSFVMGSFPGSDEWGPHTVTLDSFWIDQTEVTNAQYVALMNIKGNPVDQGWTWIEIEMIEDAQIRMVGDKFEPDPGMDDHPVVEVTWPGAYAYCEWVGGRLLTEAEWEYAARGPENYIYPWGNEEPTCELVQFAGCGDTSAPVGSLSIEGASWVGAMDMAGNVWEWTADFKAEYPKEPQINPTGPETVETWMPEIWMHKVSRGGSFQSAPETLHTAYRKLAGGSQPNLGFRCAVDSP